MLLPLLSLDDLAVIAHRGGSGLRPENTMIAFEHARALGVDAIECDVHLSRDGEAVVIHDATLDRTTDARGAVSDRTAAELACVDAGARFGEAAGFPFRAQGVGVPRLADILGRWPDTPVIIEIKGDRPDTVHAVVDVILAAGAQSRVILGGFSHTVLSAVRDCAPQLVTSASSLEVRSAIRLAWLWMAPRNPAYRLFQIPLRFRGRQVLRRYMVRAARRASIPVQAWVVDDAADMRMLFEWGVTGIISDRPDVALAEVRAMRGRPAENPRLI